MAGRPGRTGGDALQDRLSQSGRQLGQWQQAG